MERINLLVAESNSVLKEEFKRRIKNEEGINVIGVVSDGKSCLEKIAVSGDIDVLVLDMVLPEIAIPIFSLIAAVLIGQERFGWLKVVGVVVTVAGVVISQIQPRESSETP